MPSQLARLIVAAMVDYLNDQYPSTLDDFDEKIWEKVKTRLENIVDEVAADYQRDEL